MLRLDTRTRFYAALACAWAGSLGAPVAAIAEEALFRHRAAIEVRKPGAFIQVPLSPSDYARSAQEGLRDLRVVDATGERVPFTLLAPRAPQSRKSEEVQTATLYALPKASRDASGAWQSPVEVEVVGDRITVKRLGSAQGAASVESAGWLIDVGERPANAPPPDALRLAWSGPAEFSAAFDFDTSDDLRTWRHGGRGQVMALSGAGGRAIAQPQVQLPADAGRFIRLRWANPAEAPMITGAQTVAERKLADEIDAPSTLEAPASPEPLGKKPPTDDAKRGLHFDLGGVLPVTDMELKWLAGTRVAPVRIQGRHVAASPWFDLGSTVFYRLERDGRASLSPPFTLNTSVRYLRIIPDERAAPLDAGTRLVVKAHLSSLVFAAQGSPPYSLLAGSQVATSGALPASTLVPDLEQERVRFGQASLGPWGESVEAVRAIENRERQAARRPYVLWAVLLAGVAALALAVLKLARSGAGGSTEKART